MAIDSYLSVDSLREHMKWARSREEFEYYQRAIQRRTDIPVQYVIPPSYDGMYAEDAAQIKPASKFNKKLLLTR